MTHSTASTQTPVERCAYCDAPLAAEALRGRPREGGSAPGYCCYGCRVLGEGGQKVLAEFPGAESTWFKIGVGAAIAGQAMLLGLAVNLASPQGVTRILLHAALIVSTVAVFAILGLPLWRAALESLHRKRMTIELLFLAGVLGAFGASLNSTFTGVGAVYYEVVAILLTVYAVGKTLGARCRARALLESRKLQDAFDRCRRLERNGSTTMARAVEIQPGDRVQVLPGEPIPVDGVIVRGEGFVRETPLTGEPFPVVRRVRDELFAGSFSTDGEFLIAATVGGDRRRLDSLLAMVQDARDQPSAIQAQADRIVRWFLPVVLTVAAGTFAFWTWRQGFAVGLFNALAVLLVACPCAMGLATPVGLWNGLAVLASRGLVAQNADFIERLAGVTHLVFDKTGTLSEERLSLIDLSCTGTERRRRELRDILCAVQARCPHPVARAFVMRAAPSDVLSVVVRSVKTIPAKGIEAWVESAGGREMHLRVGQRELMTDWAAEPMLKAALRNSPGDNLVYIQADGRLEAIAAVRERLRDSTLGAVTMLQKLGLSVQVMTGDRSSRAEELGLPNSRGGLTARAKAEGITALRTSGAEVGFVGDGVNDAPGLQAASVGIALDHGAGIAVASADAVLYGGNLRVIPWAIALCRQVRSAIRANLWFAAAYNGIGIALAASGRLHPVAAALLMVVSSAVVSWRALRSAERMETCCGPEETTADVTEPAAAHATREWIDPSVRPRGVATVAGPGEFSVRFAKLYGLLIALQGPFMAWLGRLTSVESILVMVTCAALGLACARFRTRQAELRRYAGMLFAMLGPGNLGMLLGWWMDTGFGPVMRDGGCVCGSFHHSLATGGFEVPWMYLGMLLLGLPPMLWDRDSRRGLNVVWFALLSGLGMVMGMAWGGEVASVGSATNPSFLVMVGGMTTGMLVGMFVGCELGRAIVGWRRQRQRSGARQRTP